MVDEFKYEFYLNADFNNILNVAKAWLHSNGFKIKEEKVKENNKAYINSYTGAILVTTESATKRWLEIRVSRLSTSNYIVLYEKVTSFSDHMKSDLIKDEVLSLAAFLQSGGMPLNLQQQQLQVIAINVVAPPAPPPVPAQLQPALPSIFCIQCGTRNQTDAAFCKNCGATIE